MAIRAISGYGSKSCKCTPCVCLCMCVCAGLNTFVVYLASSLCCAMYTISVFSLDLWEGKVLCNRPSLAMDIHRDTLACIRMLGHMIRVKNV